VIKIQRIILTSRPVSYIIRKSKAMSLPGFEGIPLFDVAVFFFKQTQQIGLNERAAAIAFNFLMAVPPMGIFLFTLLSHAPDSQKLYNEALILARQFSMNDATYAIIKSVMDDFFKPDSKLVSIGLLAAIYFSSNAMITIMRTFNKSMLHIEVENRNFFQLRWMAIKLTVLIVLLIIATTLVLVTQGAIMIKIRNWLFLGGRSFEWIIQLLRLGISFLLVFFSISLIYKYAPAIQKKWKFRSPGALLATFMTIAFTYLFSYWVNNFASYNKVYGSLGSILILMLLIFVNSLVLLIGFELNVSITALKSIANKRKLEES
jgi:membrane protein